MSSALRLSFLALAAALLISIFRWTLVEYVTVFLEPLIELGAGLLFLISLLCSAIYAIKRRRIGLTKVSAPLAVNLLTALIVLFVPFTQLTIYLDFRFHLNSRTKVVDEVLAGKYESRVQNAGARGDLISLPTALSSLSSDGGEIVRLHRPKDTLVLFFSFRGILDNFSGFVYSSDDSPPAVDDFGGRFVEIERLRKNWFWAASRN